MKRKRWTMRLLGTTLLTACFGSVGGGCKQQLFMEPADYHNAMKHALEAKLETSPHEAIAPTAVSPVAAPATVLDPSRPARPMTLKECIAIGMERGTVGGSAVNPGFLNENLPTFTGRGSSGTDAIQAFALQPAIAAAEVERSMSKFDARFISSMTWNSNDQPTLSLQQSFSNGDSATLSNTLAKPLPTGGVAGITFSTQYQKLSAPPSNSDFIALNTSYTPRLAFVFEQPLLQSFGVEVNQLNANHPGSLLIPGFRTTGQGTEGILLTRIRVDQQRADFDRQVNTHLLNIETAYWNLYAEYYNLAAQEEGTKQALQLYNFFLKRGDGGIARGDLKFQNEGQYWNFRGNVIRARGSVLEAERVLRGLLGLRSDDGTRITPVDEPTFVPFKPDWTQIVQEAYQYTPQLIVARQELKARQLDILNQKNLRRPDLRLLTSYDLAGLGPRLDGAGERDNAFRSLASNQFNNWQVGLRFEMPIGFRDANALVRQAQINMKSSYLQMLDAERKTSEFLAAQYQRVEQTHALIETSRALRIATEEQIKLLDGIVKAGIFGVADITALIQAQQNLASATSAEYRAIANYNAALSSLEYAKGTIQRYNNVAVADGPLPAHVQKKAADHFAAREKAIKLREHPSEAGILAPLSQYQPLITPNQMPTGMAQPTPGYPTFGQLKPYEAAPTTPMPMPATPAKPPMPMTTGTGLSGMARPQLVPADAPATGVTFSPSGSVQLPVRARPAEAAVPVSTPAPGSR